MAANLSDVEREQRNNDILEMIRQGKSIREIAGRLGIGVSSLKRFIARQESTIKDSIKEEQSVFAKKLKEAGLPTDNWGHGWLKTQEATIYVRNQELVKGVKEWFPNLVKDIKSIPKKYSNLTYKKTNDPHCLIVDFADHHFNKLGSPSEVGSPYSTKIAIQRWHDGLKSILEKAKGFPIEKIIFVIGNDVMNIDSPKRTTTSGTLQDTDSMWQDMISTAFFCYEYTIIELQKIAPVHIIHNPSNHDFVLGTCLAMMVEQRFKDFKSVTFDIDLKHRKYIRFGTSLLGFDHGDGAKETDTPLLMMRETQEQGILTNDVRHYYFFKHHIHHRVAKEYQGILVQYLRSPSGDDRWHHTNGYIAQPAVDSFVISKHNGQVAILTHYFE